MKKRAYKVSTEQEAYRNSLLSKKMQQKNTQRTYQKPRNSHAMRWQDVVPPETIPAKQVRKTDLHRLSASWRQFQNTELYRSASHRLKKEALYEVFANGFFHSLAYGYAERIEAAAVAIDNTDFLTPNF